MVASTFAYRTLQMERMVYVVEYFGAVCDEDDGGATEGVHDVGEYTPFRVGVKGGSGFVKHEYG